MNPFSKLSGPILEAYPDLTADDLDFGAPPNLDAGDVALRTFIAAKKVSAIFAVLNIYSAKEARESMH